MNDSRKCLIIGAIGGIGRALASRLQGDGWQLILAGRKPEVLRERCCNPPQIRMRIYPLCRRGLVRKCESG